VQVNGDPLPSRSGSALRVIRDHTPSGGRRRGPSTWSHRHRNGEGEADSVGAGYVAENSTANGLSGVAWELKTRSCGCHRGTCGLVLGAAETGPASADPFKANPGTQWLLRQARRAVENLRRCMNPFK